MGYSNWPIAQVQEPPQVSLSNVFNPLVITRNNTGTRQKLWLKITVGSNAFSPSVSLLRILKPSGEIIDFEGVLASAEAVGRKFKLESIPTWMNAQNLQFALLSDPWVRANFIVTVPAIVSGSTVNNGNVIDIISKGYGAEYQAAFTAPNDPTNAFYNINYINATTANNDSISGNNMTSQIDAHLYLMPSVMLGQNDPPDTPAKMGTYTLTLGKTYFSGEKLWFDLNGLFSSNLSYNVPPGGTNWFDAGTLVRYRIVLQNSVNNTHVPFFTTLTRYVINGYTRAFEGLDMEQFVFDRTKTSFKLLTNKPRTTYVKGQREFINMIVRDKYRGGLVVPPLAEEYEVAIIYKAYTASGEYIGMLEGPGVFEFDLAEVSTCELSIDALLELFPDTGLVEVFVGIRNPNYQTAFAEVSNAQTYIVRPENISKVNTFVFLNSLGGWDAFNVDADISDSFKIESEKYTKTITPDSKKGDPIEAIYTANLEEEFNVEGAPVKDEEAEWLKELCTSKAVLFEGRYIIINDVDLIRNNTNFYRPVIKFRYSETFTNV